MSELTLHGALYTPLAHPLLGERRPLTESFAAIGARLAAQTAELTNSLTDAPAHISHYLCSTMIEACFTTGQISWPDARAALGEFPHAATAMVNAYECASWGYALRHAFRRHPEQRYFLVTVLDANVYHFSYWLANPAWGASGFGALTLLVERAGDAGVVTAGAHGSNALMEFGLAVRKERKDKSDRVLSLPFFPEPARLALARAAGDGAALPDRHDAVGHCFGSDPWLSLIMEGDAGRGRRYLMCSLALNGYFALADVTVPSTARLGVRA